MKRANVRFTPRARSELIEIAEAIATEAGDRVAESWVDRLEERARSLADHPLKGARILRTDLRRLVVAPYLIVYRLTPSSDVEILRLVHGARDLPRLLDAGR